MAKLLGACLVFAICVMGADVSGKWSGTFTPADGEGPQPAFLILQLEGDKLTGSGGPNESEQHPMENGKVEGDRLTFEVPAGKGTFFFDLRITGDEIKGDLQVKGEDQTRTAKVALKRAAA